METFKVLKHNGKFVDEGKLFYDIVHTEVPVLFHKK